MALAGLAAQGAARFARTPSRSPLHDERTAALLGIALGIAFTVCFVTGLTSHFIQRGPEWTQPRWPAQPVSLYRVTQGVHVLTGHGRDPAAAGQAVGRYPRLWDWPPVRDPLHAIERLGVAALVGGSIFQVVTGLLNVFYWYAFPFTFPIGALRGSMDRDRRAGHPHRREVADRAARAARCSLRAAPLVGSGLPRAGFLVVAGGASAVIVVATTARRGRVRWPAGRARAAPGRGRPARRAGQPRRRQRGDRGGRASPDYRLQVTGSGAARRSRSSLADLRALPQAAAELPISCVEGWSTVARLAAACACATCSTGPAPPPAPPSGRLAGEHGAPSASRIYPDHARDPLTLLALELNGEQLHIDHGYPVRLIAPNRPGVAADQVGDAAGGAVSSRPAAPQSPARCRSLIGLALGSVLIGFGVYQALAQARRPGRFGDWLRGRRRRCTTCCWCRWCSRSARTLRRSVRGRALAPVQAALIASGIDRAVRVPAR